MNKPYSPLTDIVNDEIFAEGYAAGLEAAARCAQQHGSTPGRELAETIRTLGKKESGHG